MKPPLCLDVGGLNVGYATRRGVMPVLHDVSFSIAQGETLAIVGESGSGKSTAALAIVRLLDAMARIESAHIRFNGLDIAHHSPQELRRLRGDRIGVVFQDPFTSLNPTLRIGEQVAEPLIHHKGMARREAIARAIEMLAEVNLPRPAQIARAYPHELSGGMQQRVLIAQALVCQPDLLILDEPTTALDVTVEAQILALLDTLRERHGLSILFITHNLAVVNRIADHVCVLYAGRVLERGATRNVLFRPRHPYTRGLLRAVPSLDAREPARLAAIPGRLPPPFAPPPGCVFHPRCAHAEARCKQEVQSVSDPSTDHDAACWKASRIVDDATKDRATAKPAAAPAGAPLLRVEGLWKTYRGSNGWSLRWRRPGGWLPTMQRQKSVVEAVAGVSLSIAAGEVVGLVGESGSGKSTLGRCILRLIEADRGRVDFDGGNIMSADRESLRSFRRSAQIVFQNPDSSLNPRQTIGRTLERPLMLFEGLSHSASKKRVPQLLERVGLRPDYATRYPHQLSGGEKQRVGIARALAARPRFIVCDEPVSALDVSVQANILNLLADLRDEFGLSYLFISHDLAVIAHIADRVVVMYAGSICEIGPVRSLLEPPFHPYTEMLLSAAPRLDADARSRTAAGAADLTIEPDGASTGCRFYARCVHRSNVCRSTPPPMVEFSPGHWIGCHLPREQLGAGRSVLLPALQA